MHIQRVQQITNLPAKSHIGACNPGKFVQRFHVEYRIRIIFIFLDLEIVRVERTDVFCRDGNGQLIRLIIDEEIAHKAWKPADRVTVQFCRNDGSGRIDAERSLFDDFV